MHYFLLGTTGVGSYLYSAGSNLSGAQGLGMNYKGSSIMGDDPKCAGNSPIRKGIYILIIAARTTLQKNDEKPSKSSSEQKFKTRLLPPPTFVSSLFHRLRIKKPGLCEGRDGPRDHFQ